MKKIVIFLTFAVALVFYNADTFVAPFLNESGGETSDLPQVQMELGSSTVSKQSGDNVDIDKIVGNQAEKQMSPVAEKPLEPAIRDTVRELVDTSHEGLVERKTDNGVAMDLKGKFRTAPVATINEDGVLTIRDYTAPPLE